MRFHDSALGNPTASETNGNDVARAWALGANLKVNRLYTVKVKEMFGTIIEIIGEKMIF